MTLVKMAQNPTLKGHKLLILTNLTPPQEWLDAIKERYPGLKAEFYHQEWFATKPGPGFPSDGWKDVTVLLSGSTFPAIEDAPKLQYVQLVSAGANHILDLPLFRDTDVTFCTANGVHGPQISEWVITTFLHFQHDLTKYIDQKREGRWVRGSEIVRDAVGQRVGILGYGAIGRQTARVATALGMDVHAYTLHPRKTPESKKDNTFTPPGLGDPDGILPSKWFAGESKEELHAFLGSGLDLLVIALPLTPKTQQLLSAPEFEVLSKKQAFLSNIGRGPIVHTGDLIEALDKGLLRGAALDVTDPEPLPVGHPLWSAKNLFISPHVSGGSSAYNERVLSIVEVNLENLSKGKELANRVNRKEGY